MRRMKDRKKDEETKENERQRHPWLEGMRRYPGPGMRLRSTREDQAAVPLRL